MNELILYTFLNTMPVCNYNIAPDSIIGEGSYFGTDQCKIEEIQMDNVGNITILCEEIRYVKH